MSTSRSEPLPTTMNSATSRYKYFQPSGLCQDPSISDATQGGCSSTSACSDRSSNSSSCATASDSSKSNRHVSFAHLIIREYELGLGDHPCVSSGPPVSIGWTFIPETQSCITVDEYESSRPPRRSPSQMVMPRALRESLLSDIVEYSPKDIQEAIRKARKVKVQRQQTMRKLNMSPYEEALQGALRRVKQIVWWRADAKEQRRLWNHTPKSTSTPTTATEE
jgi:hypothetical protein